VVLQLGQQTFTVYMAQNGGQTCLLSTENFCGVQERAPLASAE
jgi:hypothetical protein